MIIFTLQMAYSSRRQHKKTWLKKAHHQTLCQFIWRNSKTIVSRGSLQLLDWTSGLDWWTHLTLL